MPVDFLDPRERGLNLEFENKFKKDCNGGFISSTNAFELTGGRFNTIAAESSQ